MLKGAKDNSKWQSDKGLNKIGADNLSEGKVLPNCFWYNVFSVVIR